MSPKRIAVTAFLCLVASCVISCSRQEPSDALRIGAVLPLTGNMSMIGVPEQIGIQIALEQLALGGNDATPVVRFGDSQGSPMTAVTVARELIAKWDLDCLVVSTAPCVLAVEPVAREHGIPLFAITSQPDVADGRTVFRISPNSADETVAIFDYAREVGYGRIAIIYPNNELGLSIRAIAEQLSAPDALIDFATEYTVGDRDFRPIMLKLKSREIDAVYFAGYPFDIPAFARQFAEHRLSATLLTSMAAVWPSATEELVEASLAPIFPTPAFGVPALRSDAARQFDDLFRSKARSPANYDAAFSYDTIMIIARLLGRNGENRSASLLWSAQGTYDGISGSIQFLPDGDTQIPLYMATISQGEVVDLDEKTE